MIRHSLIVIEAVFCLWLLASCEKPVIEKTDHSAETSGRPAETTANFVLSVKGFHMVDFDGTRSEQRLSDYCSRLNFVVYQDGKKQKGINQTSTDSDFGRVTFALSPGTYQVLVLAHSAQKNPTLTNPEKIQFTNADGYTDTFYYYGVVDMSEAAKSEEVVLNRVTSMFRFEMKDAVPAEVEQVRFYYTGGSGALNALTGYGCVNSQQTVFFDITAEMKNKPQTFEVYTIPKAQTGTLKMTITAYGKNAMVIREKVLEDVPVEVNKVTEYSGSFFTDDNNEEPHEQDDNGQHSYSIQLLTEWADTLKHTY